LLGKLESEIPEEKQDAVTDLAKGAVVAIASDPNLTTEQKTAEAERKLKPIAEMIQLNPRSMSAQDYEKAISSSLAQVAANYEADPKVSADDLVKQADALDSKRMNSTVLRVASAQKRIRDMIKEDPNNEVNSFKVKEALRLSGITEDDINSSPLFKNIVNKTLGNVVDVYGQGLARQTQTGVATTMAAEPVRATRAIGEAPSDGTAATTVPAGTEQMVSKGSEISRSTGKPQERLGAAALDASGNAIETVSDKYNLGGRARALALGVARTGDEPPEWFEKALSPDKDADQAGKAQDAKELEEIKQEGELAKARVNAYKPPEDNAPELWKALNDRGVRYSKA
jgi:hypothetical protein